MTIAAIFGALGRPNNESWPKVTRLPGWYKLCDGLRGSDGLDFRSHTGRGEEVGFLTRFFTSGPGKCASDKYSLPTSCYDLLAGLLTLCPAYRLTTDEALASTFFTTEKPTPEWHAWHWALSSS